MGTLLATTSVTFLVRWMTRSSMWSTMLRILSTRLLSFLHAGLVPRLTLRASTELCWRETNATAKSRLQAEKNNKTERHQCRENNLAEFCTASLSNILNDKAGVVSRVSSATGDTVHNCCASRNLHMKCEHNDLHC